MAACSSDDVIEEVKPIVESTDPMRFSNVSDNYQTRTDYTIPNLLKQGFMVSCYKKFGQPDQQTVMPQYEVNYEPYDSWYGEKVSWNYISAESSHQFYQEQYVKFWDYSAFPYRFHAIAPYPVDPSAITLSDKSLTINNPYKMQTSLNGLVTPADAEPHLVAQVQRDGLGNDIDVFANKDITGENHTAHRYVSLPFHHLNS